MTAGDRTAALVARWVAWSPPAPPRRRRRTTPGRAGLRPVGEQRADAARHRGPRPWRSCAAWSPGCRPTCAGARSSWRSARGVGRATGGRGPAGRCWPGVGGSGLAALVAVFFQLALGVVTAGGEGFPGAAARGLTTAAGGLLVLGGLALRRRSRVAGDLAIAVGGAAGRVLDLDRDHGWLGTLAFSAITVGRSRLPWTRPRPTSSARRGRPLGGDGHHGARQRLSRSPPWWWPSRC